MARLLSQATARAILPDNAARLLAACKAEAETQDNVLHPTATPAAKPLIEPLSERELDVLQLLAQGLSNRRIGDRLFLALSTVKGHNRNIYAKLQVRRRTEAVARALGLL